MNKYPAFIQRQLFMRRMFSTGINYSDPKNPKVFLQVSRDGQPLGKMTFEVTKIKFNSEIYLFVALRKS